MALDYLAYQQNVRSPLEMAMAGYQSGAQMRQTQQKQALLQQQQVEAAQMKADLASLASNPDVKPQDYIAMMAKYPTLADNLKAPLEGLTEQQAGVKRTNALNVFSALQSGQTGIAESILQDNLTAAENSGNKQEADSSRALLQLVRTNPEAAKTSAGLYLANSMGEEKFAETWTKLQDETRNQKLATVKFNQELASLNLTNAQVNKEKADTRRIESVIAKTNTEATQVAQEVKLKQLEYQQKLQQGGVELSSDAEKLINTAVQDQVNLTSLANQYDSLAGQITAELGSGATAQAAETVKKVWGSENEVTRIRQEYKRLRNSQVLQSLPPGVASDKDIEIAMGAFPSETASPDTIASFLRGMAKLNRYDANLNGAKAEWVSQVGTLRPAPKDINVGGTVIKKGTTFGEAINQLFVPASALEPAAGSQPATDVGAMSAQQLMQEADRILSK